jgi:predicted ATP-binding protein involved in virulence
MTRLLTKDNIELLNLVKGLNLNIDGNTLPIISYHGTGRLWEQDYKNSSKMENLTRLDGYKDSLNAKSNYRNFISWFKKLENQYFNTRKEIPLLESVRNTIIKLLSILTKKDVALFIYIKYHYLDYN